MLPTSISDLSNKNLFALPQATIKTKNESWIKSIASRCFNFLKETFNVLTFPLRYLGAKSWSIPGIILRTPGLIFKNIFCNKAITKQDFFGSGYHHTFDRQLSAEEMKEHLRYVSYGLIPFKYEEDKWAIPFGAKIIPPQELELDFSQISGNLQAYPLALIDQQTTLKTVILEDDKELIVAFGAMHSHWNDNHTKEVEKKWTIRQFLSCVRNYIGGCPPYFEQASELVEKLKIVAKKKNKTLVVTGQSLAGSIASYASLKQSVKGICINAVQLGAGLQKQIGDQKLAQADTHLFHISIKNDLVTDFPGIGLIDRLFSHIIGLKTPGNFGKKTWIPSVFSDMRNSHDFPIKSVMHYLGYDKESKACDLKTKDIIKVHS